MEPVSRRRLLAASGGAILASALVGKGVVSADNSQQPNGPSPWARRWDVLMNMRGWESMREPAAGTMMATGPFQVAGTVYPVGAVRPDGTVVTGADSVGDSRAFWWIYDATRGRGVATMVISTDEGDLVFTGLAEGARVETWAVTGGTGRFKGANGEADVWWYNRDVGAFRVTVDIGTI